jgi:hypothetical protein
MGIGFQRTVMMVSIVLLVLSLILIGVTLYRQKYADITFPPVVAECPDYWENVSTDDNVVICKNVKNLGKCNLSEKNFSGQEFTGNSGLCEKQKWAKDCGIVWDGITNNTEACKV